MIWKKSDGRSLRGAVTVTKTVTITRDGDVSVETSAPRPTRTLGKRGPALSFPKAPKPWRSEPFKKFVREHPCVFVSSSCYGSIEAHHHGKHPVGQKTDDSRCVPLCQGHHRDVTDSGYVHPRVGTLDHSNAPHPVYLEVRPTSGGWVIATNAAIAEAQVELLVKWLARNKEKSR